MSRQKDEIQAGYDPANDHSVIEDVLKAIAPLVATAAVKAATTRDKAAPVVDQTKDRIQPLADTAREKLTPVADQAKEKLAPAADQAKQKLAPVAEQAKGRGQDIAGQAKERLAPVADQARERGLGLAEQAKEQGAHLTELLAPLAAAAVAQASQAKDKAVPLVGTAQEKVSPAVETARAKVQDDLVPSLLDLLHQAEAHPAVSEATTRGKATVAALKGEIAVPEPDKKSSAGQKVAKVAAAGAVLAAVAVAVRTFLGSKDDEWTAHQPSAAYVPSEEDATLDQAETEAPSTLADVETEANPQTLMTEEGGPVADQAATISSDEAPAPLEETKVDHDSKTETEPEAVMSDEGGITDDSETTSEDINVLNEYGEGSYVGDEAPAEYTVKGNERSMKFHTPESDGYDRTIPDVWFNSVEAAERAGFTRAQR